MIKKIFYTSILILSSIAMLQAQPWMKQFENRQTPPTYFEIREAFEEYAEGKEQHGTEAVKGKDLEDMDNIIPGYEIYKRWEYFYESRVDENGNLPNGTHIWNEYLKQNANKSLATDTTNHGNWSLVGPSVGVPEGGGMGRINVVKFNPKNSKTIWAGSPAGGLWKSINAGNSWLPTTTDKLPVLGISDIAINSIDTNVMYIATGDAVAAVGYTRSVGILKSTDCGLTWSTTGISYLLSAPNKIRRLLINPLHPDTIIAVTSLGAFISADAAATWVLAKSGLNFQDIEVKPDDPNTIYLSSTNGIYKSTNAGFSFVNQNLALNFANPNSIGRIELEVTPANSNVIYALCSNASTDGFQYIYKSNDAGVTWTQGATGPNIIGGDENGAGTDGNGWYNLSLAVSPTNDNVIFVGGVNVWKSSNGGQSFQLNAYWVENAGHPYVHADIHNITFRPVAPGSLTSNELYIGCDGGVFKSNNVGQTWVDLSLGLQIMQLYRMSSSSITPDFMIAGAQDNGTNFFNSNFASEIHGGDGMDCTIDPSDDQTMYASSQNGNYSRSVDGGANFEFMGPDNQDGNGKWLTPMAISKSSPTNIYLGYKDVFKSNNNGGDWFNVTNNISNGVMYQYIAVAPSDDNVVYACTSSKIFKSLDGGNTWVACMTGLPPSMSYMQLAVSEDDPNIVYAVASNYTAINKVFKSTNAGGNWKNISFTGLPAVPVNSVICQKNNRERVYVGTDLGVYYTDTTLTVWKDFNNNLPNTYVMDFDIYYPTYTLYAATYGRGIWQTKLIVDNLEDVADIDFNSKVSIFPNPAINKLSISLDYQSSFTTNINIFSIDGKLVFESKIPTNTNILSVDLSNFTSGTYLVKVANGNKTTHQKLVVMPN